MGNGRICAQIGKNVHLSGGVGIGGVLEPLQAAPVIIEDNAFVGSRCIVVEGAPYWESAVLGANVVITKSTKVIDVSGEEPVIYQEKSLHQGRNPGSTETVFSWRVQCALRFDHRRKKSEYRLENLIERSFKRDMMSLYNLLLFRRTLAEQSPTI